MTEKNDPESYEELLAEIYGPRRELIKAFSFFDGKVNSKKLFDVANAPRQSKHHYLTTLEGLGLIEKTGTEHAGSGGEAFVWALTDKGEMVADDVADADVHTIADFEQLEERVTALEHAVESASDKETGAANGEAIEELREEMDDLRTNVSKQLEAIRDAVNER